MIIVATIFLALLLDFIFEEPKRHHPLVWFGNWAAKWERRFNATQSNSAKGVLAWMLAVLPWVWLANVIEHWIQDSPFWLVLVGAVFTYVAVGWRSLLNHAMAVAYPLSQGNLAAAQAAVGRIVSRDVNSMDEKAVASAATESVLENGADAIFAAVFWFVLLGIPGVVLYRLSNTLDAMWGYKNERYKEFGWFAARVDDVLNFVPARLTALSYLLAGKSNKEKAWQAWREQGANWKSPNAGPVMASGAGAIDVQLGGSAVYHGTLQHRPLLGLASSRGASAYSIVQACALVNRALLLWCAVLCALVVLPAVV